MSKVFRVFNDVYVPPKPSDSPLQVSVEILKELGYKDDSELVSSFKKAFPEREEVSIGEILVHEGGFDFSKEALFNLVTDLLVHYTDASAKDIFYGVNILDRSHEGKKKEPLFICRNYNYVCDKPEYLYEVETSLASITVKGLNSSLIHNGLVSDTIVDAEGVRLVKDMSGCVTLTPNAKDGIYMLGQGTRTVGNGGSGNIYRLVDGLGRLNVEGGLIISEASSAIITANGLSPVIVSDGKDSAITVNSMTGNVFSYGSHTIIRGTAELVTVLLKGAYSNAFLETFPVYFYLGDYCALTIHDIHANTLKIVRSYGTEAEVKPYTWYRVTDKEAGKFEEVLVSPF